jgi:hypothetical protein
MRENSTFASLAIALSIIFVACTTSQKRSSAETAQTGQPQPARELVLTTGPTAQSISSTTALLTWTTNISSSTALWYGLRPDNLDQVVREPFDGLTHSARLTNLRPDTTYYYRVIPAPAGHPKAEPVRVPASFKTQPAGPKRTEHLSDAK